MQKALNFVEEHDFNCWEISAKKAMILSEFMKVIKENIRTKSYSFDKNKGMIEYEVSTNKQSK